VTLLELVWIRRFTPASTQARTMFSTPATLTLKLSSRC
jgi:hypothetical protein